MVQEGELALNQGIPIDSIENGEVQLNEEEPIYGMIFTSPISVKEKESLDKDNGVSFILLGVFLLFLIISLRFRNNFKYIVSIFHNLIETRTRQNIFDDTVNESSLILLLNILWCVGAGIIGFCLIAFLRGDIGNSITESGGLLWGMLIAGIYSIFMWVLYSSVGWIFSDSQHSGLWVKGFTASQALTSPGLFVMALLGLCRPSLVLEAGVVAGIIFLSGKLIFIWKGYRIFFHQISSWVLFLCYLCSIEIVPLILCYRCAILLG